MKESQDGHILAAHHIRRCEHERRIIVCGLDPICGRDHCRRLVATRPTRTDMGRVVGILGSRAMNRTSTRRHVAITSAMWIVFGLFLFAPIAYVALSHRVTVGSEWIQRSVDPWAADTTPKSVVADVQDDWVKLCVVYMQRDDFGRLVNDRRCQAMRAGELRTLYRRVE